jgi:tetratricopeptide (TPR) repeat protein
MSKKRIQPEVQAIISAADAGLYATTVKLAEAFLADNPDSLRGWLDLGHALTCLCRYDDAVAAYERAKKLAEESGQSPDGILAELGQLHRQKGDFDRAAECFDTQIAASPDDASGYLMKAALQLQSGHAQQSVSTLERALDCKTGCHEEVHYSLGLALRSAGDLTHAKKHFQKALDLDANYAAAKSALKDVK